mmetsp:Transcript_13970/g.38207  ORF Transcript_13970/g.38207 Transcript_13970/m.38207 type:complete len:213 (-) Transcript_13970:52-690(-)
MIRCAGFSARLAISFLSSAATSATSWSASFWFITASVRSSTASGRLVRRQSTVYAICSRDADASKFAPITSASRVTRKAVRLAVDLHAMRSRRCDAPETYGFSHLEPELTYMPTAMDAPGVSSEAILAPLLSVVMLVTGAAAGAAGGSGMDKPATGWSIGGMAGPEEPPKMALIMDGLGTAVVSAGSAMRAPAEVLTPRVAARRALERTMVR